MRSRPTRRDLLRWTVAGAVVASLDGVGGRAWGLGVPTGAGLQPPDALGWRLLPGFTSRVVATTGQPVAGSSFPWHRSPDGGATFPKLDGGWSYVSNSEVPDLGGGASVVDFGPDGSILGGRAVLTGTVMNCSGGATPWGTWLSCEEHPLGAVYEVDPTGARPPARRPAMGFFQHEGAAIDPDRQVVYLSEDRPDGGLYRFRPLVWGDLAVGALDILTESGGALRWAEVDASASTRLPHLQRSDTRRFNGGEGIAYWRGSVVFTTKGDNRVWLLDPDAMRLTVLYDAAVLAAPVYTGVDQIVVAPWGDLVGVEDGGDMQVIVLGPDGSVNVFAQLTGVSGSELTGLAFDPSGTRLYVTSQRNPGRTYEISGPFPTLAPPAGTTPGRLVALTPARILDTRTGLGSAARAVPADGAITLQVAGRGGVPADATAVVLNLTATEATAPGFVTVWPFGQARPVASNLNVERPGQTIANLVTVPLGAGGAVSIYTQGGTHLVADVAACFRAAPDPVTAGRFRPVTPARLLDTRDGGRPRLADGAQVDVAVAGRAGVPESGAAAAVLTVTATDAAGAGFVTCWPGGAPRPLASNLNLERPGHTVANQVIVPVGADGRISLFTQSSAHLVVDLAAWVTDTSRPTGTQGRFVAVAPYRVLDTRIGLGAPAGILAAAAQVALSLGGTGVVPADATGVVLNVTLTEARAPGFVTVWPADQIRPLASNLNATDTGQTIATHVLVALSPAGTVALFTQSGGHLVADVAGWLTG